MDPHTTLRRNSALVAAFCLIIAVMLPVFVLLDFATRGPTAFFGAMLGQPLPVQPGTAASLAGLILTMIPFALLASALIAARRCFRAFAAGDWFSETHTGALTAAGKRIFAAGFLSMIPLPLILSLILTLGAPVGDRMILLSVGEAPIMAMLAGAMIWCLGAVWEQARQIAAENREFV